MTGPYRTAAVFEQRPVHPCKVCRYVLDPCDDDFYCCYDDVPPHCKGPYIGPEPPVPTLWQSIKGLFTRRRET